VKACIPLAGLLLLLQAFANLFRDLGLAPPAGGPRSTTHRRAAIERAELPEKTA
jgi:hypothetical protein